MLFLWEKMIMSPPYTTPITLCTFLKLSKQLFWKYKRYGSIVCEMRHFIFLAENSITIRNSMLSTFLDILLKFEPYDYSSVAK